MNNLRQFYSTEGYEKWGNARLTQQRVRKLASEIELVLLQKKALKVLDIGSGTGNFLHSLARKYPQHAFYGCDIADNVIRSNKRKKKGITWSVQDLNTRTSYKRDYFDVIIAGEILEHLYDTDNFYLETHRILKRGGVLIITTPNLASWMDRIFLLFGWQPHATEVSNVSRRFGREGYYKMLGIRKEIAPAGHLRCFTWGALKDMTKHYKFKVEKQIGCHSHDLLVNEIATFLFPKFAQNQLLVARKF